MNRAMPVIQESADDLKHRLQQERDPRKRQRLQLLYLIASGQARRRTHAAQLLGVERNTVGRWLTQYAQGGLAALLDLDVPQGRAPALAPDQRAAPTALGPARWLRLLRRDPAVDRHHLGGADGLPCRPYAGA
jgi:transposase-like protein